MQQTGRLDGDSVFFQARVPSMLEVLVPTAHDVLDPGTAALAATLGHVCTLGSLVLPATRAQPQQLLTPGGAKALQQGLKDYESFFGMHKITSLPDADAKVAAFATHLSEGGFAISTGASTGASAPAMPAPTRVCTATQRQLRAGARRRYARGGGRRASSRAAAALASRPHVICM